jgi:hypothetical protein
MTHLRSVRSLGDGRSRWQAEGPPGVEVAWEAEISDRRIDERIAWRSLASATVANQGEVEFRPAPGRRGTEVRHRRERPSRLRPDQASRARRDRPAPRAPRGDHGLRQRRVVSVIGVYAGQCHVHRYLPRLMERILAGEIDPSFVITHRMALEDAPRGYQMFRDKQDDCEKVVLTP